MQILTAMLHRRNCQQDEVSVKQVNKTTETLTLAQEAILTLTYPFYKQSLAPIKNL